MASDHAGKKAALEARLTALDADAKRVAEKRKVTEQQLAGLAAKAESTGEPKPAKAAKRAAKR